MQPGCLLGRENLSIPTKKSSTATGPRRGVLAPRAVFIHDPGTRMKTYRGFLFDADNTLFDYDRAETEAITETIVRFLPNVPLPQALATYHEINSGYWRRFERGDITLRELKPARFASLLEALDCAGDPEEISTYYLTNISRRAYFLPHAREVLELLSRSCILGIVTNGIELVQRGRLARSGVEDLFRAVVISEVLGIAKPNPRFFHAAAEAVSLPPEELLCVGDNAAVDIAGARAAGIDACWYSPQGQAWPGPGEPPELIIDDLRDLLPLAASDIHEKCDLVY